MSLELQLSHGRKDPLAEMQRAGYFGPCIHGIESFRVTYCQLHRLIFTDQDLRDKAMAATGWDIWDELTLQIRIEQGMVRIDTKEGPEWFGDWKIEQKIK